MVVAEGLKVFMHTCEGYLCLFKIVLFLSFRRLYFIYFLFELYMEKVLQELFWANFFGHPYRSNGTKIHLNATVPF